MRASPASCMPRAIPKPARRGACSTCLRMRATTIAWRCRAGYSRTTQRDASAITSAPSAASRRCRRLAAAAAARQFLVEFLVEAAHGQRHFAAERDAREQQERHPDHRQSGRQCAEAEPEKGIEREAQAGADEARQRTV